MCHKLSHTFDETKLGSVQDLIATISQQAFNEGWGRHDVSCRRNCLPSLYLADDGEEIQDEDGGASLLKTQPRVKARTKSGRRPRPAPRRTTKAQKPRSTRNTRRATSEPSAAADDNSDYETDTAPQKRIKRYDLGISRRFVTKASNEKEQMQLTEPEAIRWHRMEGTEYKRTKGKIAEKDEEIELNLIRFRKQIRRKICKGLQDRQDEEEEVQAILGDSEDELEGENDNEGEGEGVDENGNEGEREQSSESEVNFGMPVYQARARSTESQWSEAP
ncbi:hypothetical protein BKA65DRAFT_483559 [Rhexocercosporidium sp. MPI-PUGE-AT-0058]|nr:hypothetical protein BKA65DRAFT_483559 [Rhexocercosporidium sp. MPI-PUGE-AT-0058]